MNDANGNPLGYNGNPNVKRDGAVHEFTAHEVSEYMKCMEDPGYFAETYVKVINLNKGLVPFKLYDYQREMFKHFKANRFSIVLACRQSGKSISSVVYLLWYACFHSEKTIAILANKGATAQEMLARVTLALENLPFFLQPGCKSLNKRSIEFSNNSKIITAGTNSASIRGLSVNLLFLDEFAFVKNSNEFYTSTYPVISSGEDSRVIITSTANGVGNLFYRLWQGACQNENTEGKEGNYYKPFRVDWWDVPGRDEKWKEMTIANTSPLQFEQEFGNTFTGTSNTLLNGETLLGLKAKNPEEVNNKIRYYHLPVREDLDEGIVAHQYVMTVDVAKGRGQDYSTFTVTDVSTKPFMQVATFRCNLISPLLFPDIIVRVAKQYNDAIVIIESNDAGVVVCNTVYYEYEYENTFVESTTKSGGIGVNMTKKVKRIGCSHMKDLIESGNLLLCDVDTITELSIFEHTGNSNSYAAAGDGHDDLVMNLVLFSWFVSSNAFGDIATLDLKTLLYADRMREMEEDVPSFGFIRDGVSDYVDPVYEEMVRQRQEWAI